MHRNPNLGLVNINAYTKFGKLYQFALSRYWTELKLRQTEWPTDNPNPVYPHCYNKRRFWTECLWTIFNLWEMSPCPLHTEQIALWYSIISQTNIQLDALFKCIVICLHEITFVILLQLIVFWTSLLIHRAVITTLQDINVWLFCLRIVAWHFKCILSPIRYTHRAVYP